MRDAIYMGNTEQTFKKRMDGHFYDLQRLLNNGQNSDSFAAHFVHKLGPLSHPVELLEAIFICKVTAEENKISGRRRVKYTTLFNNCKNFTNIKASLDHAAQDVY